MDAGGRPSRKWSDLSERVMQRILAHLSLGDAVRCSFACRSWYSLIQGNEDSEFWERESRCRIPSSTGDTLSSLSSSKSRVRAAAHCWDGGSCSRNMYLKGGGFTVHRNPVAQSTDGARGRIGFSRGRHCWEVWWDGPLGTVSMVGVCTEDQVMQSAGYLPLLGSTASSWAWNLVDNSLMHDGSVLAAYPAQNNAPRYQTGERIRVLLDCERRTLAFEKNYEFLGIAFVGLPVGAAPGDHDDEDDDEEGGEERQRINAAAAGARVPPVKLFPAISAVYGNTEVSMVYLGFPMDG